MTLGVQYHPRQISGAPTPVSSVLLVPLKIGTATEATYLQFLILVIRKPPLELARRLLPRGHLSSGTMARLFRSGLPRSMKMRDPVMWIVLFHGVLPCAPHLLSENLLALVLLLLVAISTAPDTRRGLAIEEVPYKALMTITNFFFFLPVFFSSVPFLFPFRELDTQKKEDSSSVSFVKPSSNACISAVISDCAHDINLNFMTNTILFLL